ncbi:uncharacterized protein PITG_15351 [Phytophthora infestans T30-4]|uniref:Peptidase S33 tripeptidyl aminopeptidase-like C-terminal domain-containing protein n=1 Tax=Phytophthora infestans (strain T30-4) TaxID=403677 RepID=D0NQH7_PHYIT|nr:uncharacterized protein PITG_15351 [Phytophthora infestans T30-4]EEY62909.1 conserved hypothetical protein [Phytophthora infestans T30-4]|eukprot:XP_002898784.1 conserved hypothetical protein [Phytophthora infestans T30-4]
MNVWLLQGGPGASSTDLESTMVTLHSELNGTTNVYTMDHRDLVTALSDSGVRTLIPPLVYRRQRCAPDDLDVLNNFFSAITYSEKTTAQDSAYTSTLLQSLIVYSEMMETPLPSMSELKDRFTNVKMSSGSGVYETLPQYCAFSKDKSASCEEINVGNYESDGIVYKRDQYWNKTATIPNQASVLVLSGKLDPQTPHKNAASLFKYLQGTNKEMVAFDFATHGTNVSTQMVAGNPLGEACGMKELAS